MNKKVTLGLLLLTVVALIGIPQALAFSSYTNAFNTKYGTSGTSGGTTLGSCITCHTNLNGGASWNLYGLDVQGKISSGINGALTAVEPTDSDHDGFTNINEINAGTFPGDPKSTPAPAPTPPPASTYTVTFTVTNSAGPLQGASVVMDGIKKKTNNFGKAEFTNVANGDHKYTVSMRGYKRASGTVTVKDADASQPVILTRR